MGLSFVNCAHHATPGGFLERHLGPEIAWTHVSATAELTNAVLRRIRRPDMKRIVGCYRAAKLAKATGADLIISHDPRVTFPLEHFRRLVGGTMPHLAYSFNYPWIPKGYKGWVHRKAFETVTRFVVYSTLERQLYHEQLGIPLEKLDFVHWGVNPPKDDGLPPPEPFSGDDYVCALGENSRDYATLMAAMKQLPDIPLVMVVRPHNLVGLDVPPNVRVLTSIPFPRAMAVLRHARFMALPLTGPDVPCGHVTLVNAMHLGKAFAITRSSGVADYCRHEDNALLVPHHSADDMAGAIRALWDDAALCRRLGESGRRFAAEVCSEANIVANFRRLLSELGLAVPPLPGVSPGFGVPAAAALTGATAGGSVVSAHRS